jgi:prepilin-type N-terminal cleavage/methylation domain-containing protein
MRNARRHLGFTLMELMVAIVIIVILVALTAVAVMKGQASAMRSRMAADLQTISIALEAYKQDFGDYPRINPNPAPGLPGKFVIPDPTNPQYISGAELLCWALVGPFDAGRTNPLPQVPSANFLNGVAYQPDSFLAADGADGPGFRIKAGRGLVYGPYIHVDKIHFGTNPAFARYPYLMDARGNPILYFPANTAHPDVTTNNGYAAAAGGALFDFRDNGISFCRDPMLADYGTTALQRFQVMLGADSNGKLIPGQTAISAPFILWSAGLTGDVNSPNFGPTDPTDPKQVLDCDNVISAKP